MQFTALVCMQLPVPSRRLERCATFPRVAPGAPCSPRKAPFSFRFLFPFTLLQGPNAAHCSAPLPVFAWRRVSVGGNPNS